MCSPTLLKIVPFGADVALTASCLMLSPEYLALELIIEVELSFR